MKICGRRRHIPKAMMFCAEQEAAISLLAGSRGPVVLNGGPGTGKTACISEALDRLGEAEDGGPEVVQVSPGPHCYVAGLWLTLA